MARQGRVKSETGVYHVLLRGIDMLFAQEEDYAEFYAVLKRHTKEGRLRLISYALLKNRIHLVVDASGSDIGLVLKPICTGYARYFNRTHDTGGRLFYDRFKSEPINSHAELAAAAAFVNAAALREEAQHCSLSEEGRQICAYSEAGLSEEEFSSGRITAVFIEDFDRLPREAIEGIIHALSGVYPGEFKKLALKEQERVLAVLTAERWLSKSKIYDILGIKKPALHKPAPKKAAAAEEEKQQPEEAPAKDKLSVWLL